MKMKPFLALAAVTAVGAATAEVTTVNTLCRIEIDSGTASTIVAVPLTKISASGSDEAIPATSLVLTDNLEDGDTIFHWNTDTSKWDAWIIADGAWTATTIAEGTSMSTTAPAADTTFKRGDAIWVNRQTPGNKFYIYGQMPTAGSAESVQIVGGSSDSPAYTMVGNPTTEKKSINSLTFAGGTPSDGDLIVWGNKDNALGRTEFRYDSSKDEGEKWGYYKATEVTLSSGITVNKMVWTAADVEVEPGQGFWYVTTASTSLTVSW
ncbi:MAG: hypothetical protein ACI4R9_01305 [Kiritimatiellia bacterium]